MEDRIAGVEMFRKGFCELVRNAFGPTVAEGIERIETPPRRELLMLATLESLNRLRAVVPANDTSMPGAVDRQEQRKMRLTPLDERTLGHLAHCLAQAVDILEL